MHWDYKYECWMDDGRDARLSAELAYYVLRPVLKYALIVAFIKLILGIFAIFWKYFLAAAILIPLLVVVLYKMFKCWGHILISLGKDVYHFIRRRSTVMEYPLNSVNVISPHGSFKKAI